MIIEHNRIIKVEPKDVEFGSITITPETMAVGDSAFAGITELEKITIPSNICMVGKASFKGCTNLKSVIFEEGAVKIGEGAFESCNDLKHMRAPFDKAVLDKYIPREQIDGQGPSREEQMNMKGLEER